MRTHFISFIAQMDIPLNSKQTFLVLFGSKMAATIRSLCSSKSVTFTEVNHPLCSSLAGEESSNVFPCRGMCCVYFYHRSSVRQANLMFMFIRNSGFTLNFHSPLESTWLATNLPWRTSKLSVCTVLIFFVVTTYHQRFSPKFNESPAQWIEGSCYIV